MCVLLSTPQPQREVHSAKGVALCARPNKKFATRGVRRSPVATLACRSTRERDCDKCVHARGAGMRCKWRLTATRRTASQLACDAFRARRNRIHPGMCDACVGKTARLSEHEPYSTSERAWSRQQRSESAGKGVGDVRVRAWTIER
eukprot:6176916-Pleurochrysis_carterae.AAC.2